MPRKAIAFLAGICALYFCPQFPPGALLCAGLPFLLSYFYKDSPKWVCWFVAGFTIAWLNGASHLASRLPDELSGKDFDLIIMIETIPETDHNRSRFIATTVNTNYSQALPTRMMLNWYHAPANLRVGDTWHVRVRLRSPRGFMNPGGFDYERWLFSRKIGATGYVRESSITRKLHTNNGIVSARQEITEVLSAYFPGDAGALLVALSTGYRGAVPDHAWRILERTGTRHLLAISGMHIGMAALLGFFFGRFAWKIGPGWFRLLPRRVFATIISALPATTYAAMAGFSVPTQRALCAVLAISVALVLRKDAKGINLLAGAAVAVLLYDPAAVLETAFWLSFTVSLALVCITASIRRRRLWSFIFIQILLFPVLASLTAWHFLQVSWVSPLANLLAIPLFTFLLVPLVLLGLLLFQFNIDLAMEVFGFANQVMQYLYLGLGRAADWEWAYRDVSPGQTALFLAMLFSVIWVMPKYFPGRAIAVLLLVPIFSIDRTIVSTSDLRVHVLDVGQGLAAVIQTRSHVVIYDTGPSFRSGSSAASLVLLPFLEMQHATPDMLIVSHADSDHAGGIMPLLERFPGLPIVMPGVDNDIQNAFVTCQRGLSWTLDEIKFEILHPEIGTSGNRNNESCVLKVSVGNHAILFTGDIEAEAEAILVSGSGESLKSTVLVVPHHGSRSSSTNNFICRVMPELAIVSAGYKNRWGFPIKEVVKRYNERKIPVFNTANEGAISLLMSREEGLVEVSGYRNGATAIWRATGGGRIATILEFQYDSLMLQQQDAKLDEAKNQCLN